MNDILVIYASKHLGNTKKLVCEAASKVDFVDVVDINDIDNKQWATYKVIGFASGIKASSIYPELKKFIKKQEGYYKEAFTVLTSGSSSEKHNIAFRNLLEESNFTVRNQFICKGENHFILSRILGKTNKGFPTQEEVDSLVKFFQTQKRRFIDNN